MNREQENRETQDARETRERPEKRPGYRSGMRGVWFGLAAILTSPVPAAGFILGAVSMKWANRCKAESERYQQGLGNFGRFLGGTGIFLNVLITAMIISVAFLTWTDIINLGAR